MRFFRICGVIFCAFWLFSTPLKAQALSTGISPAKDGNAVLIVNGKAEVKHAPDLAVFETGVTTIRPTAEEALRDNAVRMQRVFDSINKLGIAKSDIQTSDVSIRPIMDDGCDLKDEAAYAGEADTGGFLHSSSDKCDGLSKSTPKITGYKVTNTVTILQRKLNEFGKTIDTIIAVGGNKLAGPYFKLENSQYVFDEVNALAIKDAKRRAELYAAAADMRVKRIMKISEGHTFEPYPDTSYLNIVETETAPPVPTAIESGMLTIEGSVSVTFELEPI